MTDQKAAGGEPDRRVLVLNDGDNVGVACSDLAAGTEVLVAGRAVTLLGTVTLGHKLALVAMEAGERIIKWGAPIGSATQAIAAGEHVHLHNMKSDYIPTYTFEEGRRFVAGRDT